MESNKCLVCERIKLIQESRNPYFVAELETGYVVLADYQYFKGYTIFLCKQDVQELHMLKKEFRMKFLDEMSIVSEAVYKCFQPVKLNIELLGNTDSHVHWHIVPRYGTDPHPKGPAWLVDAKLLRGEEAKPTAEELEDMKKRLLNELQKLWSGLL